MIVAADAADFRRRGAEWIAEKVGAAVRTRGRCAVALAGGSTPRPVYQELGERDVFPWAEVEFFFGDERAVPADDPQSNYRMARETLFRRRPDARVVRMPADAPGGAAEYARRLPAELDVLILGMGADGHTASLFPGSPALGERAARVVAVTGPTPPRRRMTITPPVIEAAKEILVLVSGADKAPALVRALRGGFDPGATPAQLARRGTWLVDRAAASAL